MASFCSLFFISLSAIASLVTARPQYYNPPCLTYLPPCPLLPVPLPSLPCPYQPCRPQSSPTQDAVCSSSFSWLPQTPCLPCLCSKRYGQRSECYRCSCSPVTPDLRTNPHEEEPIQNPGIGEEIKKARRLLTTLTSIPGGVLDSILG